jgi:hypothetical protein
VAPILHRAGRANGRDDGAVQVVVEVEVLYDGDINRMSLNHSRNLHVIEITLDIF